MADNYAERIQNHIDALKEDVKMCRKRVTSMKKIMELLERRIDLDLEEIQTFTEENKEWIKSKEGS